MTTDRAGVRRGFTLVEMLTTMTTLTIVLMLCVALLELLLQMNTSGKAHVENELAIARVARAFRADVRSAERVSRCAEGGESLSLALAQPGTDRVIEYQVLRDHLVRAEWSGDSVVAQERFPLPSRSSGRFSRREENGVKAVSLVFDRRGRRGNGEATSHAFRIDAIAGEGLRFRGPKEASK